MERRENTPERIMKRRYEEKHKDERKAQHKVWGTSLDRKFAEEIDEFLKIHNIPKVALICAGYKALQQDYCEDRK